MRDVSNTPEDRKARDEGVVKFLVHMFHDVCVPDAGVPADAITDVALAWFCGWLDRRMGITDPQTVCDEAGVGLDTWDVVKKLLDGGLAPEALSLLWPRVVLARRPAPVNKVKTVNMLTLITYEDGTIAIQQALVSPQVFPDMPFDDANVTAAVAANQNALLARLAKTGVDGMHAEAQVNKFRAPGRPEDPYEVAMGYLIHKMMPAVHPDLKDALNNVIGLFQTCVRPVIPPHYLDRALAIRRAGITPKGATGGWSG